ncbi:MAG: gluconokinase [Vicinamibacterales bacterium]
MGVSGAGKTRVGRALARKLGWPFLDADDFHSPSNVAKMRGGTPLEPSDRVAWLQAMRAALAKVEETDGNAVLACSALQQAFRASLREGFNDLRFVHLKADRELIRARVGRRGDHFMPVSLVDSQFETLEEPEDALVIDASKAPEVIVQEIARNLVGG